jgi:hypothetical protein
MSDCRKIVRRTTPKKTTLSLETKLRGPPTPKRSGVNKLQKQHRRCQTVKGGRREEDYAEEDNAQLGAEAHQHVRGAV